MGKNHGRRLFKISAGAQVCATNCLGRQSQRIQGAADDKLPAPETEGTDGVELQAFTRLCRSSVATVSVAKTN
jgi:hypothetical protein